MKSLEQFFIPISGMNLGVHKYEFSIGDSFFKNFENSPVNSGQFKVNVILDKQPSMITLDIELDGYQRTSCDRCLQAISLPVVKNYQMLVKYSDEPREEAEILYINPETPRLNLAALIYEHIVLSIPITKTYDCENDPEAPCDKEMLKYLSESTQDPIDNPLWEELKNLGKLKN